MGDRLPGSAKKRHSTHAGELRAWGIYPTVAVQMNVLRGSGDGGPSDVQGPRLADAPKVCISKRLRLRWSYPYLLSYIYVMLYLITRAQTGTGHSLVVVDQIKSAQTKLQTRPQRAIQIRYHPCKTQIRTCLASRDEVRVPKRHYINPSRLVCGWGIPRWLFWTRGIPIVAHRFSNFCLKTVFFAVFTV